MAEEQKQVDIEKLLGQAAMLNNKAVAIYQNVVEMLLAELNAARKQTPIVTQQTETK